MKERISVIPTAAQALLSHGVGKPFKPEGRKVVPQDCVLFDDFLTRDVITSDLIRKLFQEENSSGLNDIGERAVRAYAVYVSELGSSSIDSEARREEADRQFREIAGFGVKEVVEFENEVRKLHKLPALPF